MLSRLDQDPPPEVIRDVDEWVSLCECADSSATVQVTHQYLQKVYCDTSTGLQTGLFLSAAAFLKMRFAVCTALSASPFDWGCSGELVV